MEDWEYENKIEELESKVEDLTDENNDLKDEIIELKEELKEHWLSEEINIATSLMYAKKGKTPLYEFLYSLTNNKDTKTALDNLMRSEVLC